MTTTERLAQPMTEIALDARHCLIVWTVTSFPSLDVTEERIQVFRTYKGDDDGAVLAGDTMVGAERVDAIARGRDLARHLGFA